MYVYLEGSGCTAFKFHKGSSRFFTVARVIVKDRDRVANLVGDVREELGLSADYEFKSSKSGQKAKQAFYEKLRMASFTARCIVVDKTAWFRNIFDLGSRSITISAS